MSSQDRQKREAYIKILRAFFNDKEERVKRTWKEAYDRSHLRKSRFSIHFRELVKKGVIRGTVIVDEKDRLISIYEFVNPLISMIGETKDTIKLTIDEHKNIIKVVAGEMVRSGKGSTYFRAKKQAP